MLNFIYINKTVVLTMTLEQLRVLQKIVQLGSLKKAAAALFKTQPALSMAIKKLEQQYNIELLDRSQYRLTLTKQGSIFYRQAQSLLLSADQLESLGHQLAQGNEAIFRIGYDPLYDISHMLQTLHHCQNKFATTEFQIVSGSRFSSLEQLANESVDVSFGAWFHLFHGVGDFKTKPINEFELVIAAAPSLVTNHHVSTLQALSNYPSITVLESGLNFDTERLGIHTAKQQFKTNDIHTLKALLCAGLGTALVPKTLISDELCSGQLQILNLDDFEHSMKGEVRMIKRSDKVLGPVGQYFWDCFS